MRVTVWEPLLDATTFRPPHRFKRLDHAQPRELD